MKSNGGAVPPNAVVEVRPVGTFGGITAFVESTGEFVATGIPVGNYDVVAFYSGFEVGRFPLTLTAGADVAHDFRFPAGFVSVHVTRNGVDDQGAHFVALNVDVPPGCFAPGATCQLGSTMDSCACTLNNRFYTCDPFQGCRYMNMVSFGESTDATGVARVLVPAGLYDVGVLSSSPFNIDQQSGFVGVARSNGHAVTDGSDVLVLDVDYQTGTLTGTITINGTPMTGAVVEVRAELGSLSGAVDANGVYSIEAPVGTYSLVALQDGSTPIRSIDNVTVAAGASTVNNIGISGALVSGDVERNGLPAPFAPVLFIQHPPTECGAADQCNVVSTTQPCSCSRDGQAYFCVPDPGFPSGMRCTWLMGGALSVHTDFAGHFSKFLTPGTYDVAMGATQEPGQFGVIEIGREPGVVVDADPIDVGLFSYSTGTASGAITSCGVSVPNVAFVLDSPKGSTGSDGIMGTGTFSLVAPEGTYTLRANLFGSELASTPVTIAAGAPVTWNPNLELGAVRGTLSRDGQPSTFSPVYLQEVAEGLACSSDDCFFDDPAGGTCFGCTATDGRAYSCLNFEPCRYVQPRFYQGNTNQDGVYIVENIVPGLYHIALGSGGGGPMPGGQGGTILVGEFDVRVAACELTEVNLDDAPVAPGVDQTVTFISGVSLTFDTITEAATVSYQTTTTPPPAAPTPSFQSAGLFYDIIVPASAFTGEVEICLPYDVDTAPADVHLYHHVGDPGSWVDITRSIDTTAHVVCGVTSSFSWFAVGTAEILPPTLSITGPAEVVADASCDGSATLTGAGSYRWYRNGQLIGTGTTVTITDLVLGPNTISAESGTQSGSFTVTLVDRTAPTLSIVASPAVLWPPNGKLVSVGPSGTIVDNCDTPPVLTVLGVTSPTALPTDIVVTGSSVQLRAFRDGKETAGRTYEIEYAATDRAGNRTMATVNVRVPHDRR